MSEFHEGGPVTSLLRLRARPIDGLEHQLEVLAAKCPVSLIIPIVPDEMDRPALSRIVDELSDVSYLDSIVVSLNRATSDDYRRAVDYFARYPGRLVIVWSESPSIQRFFERLEHLGLEVGSPGKGRACWLALGYLLAEERVHYIAFQDAEVTNFGREMLARLILPALDPAVAFDFVKAYCARLSDRDHGRVARLFVAPLLAALARLLGHDPFIRYLASFRYALSGEFTVQRDLASRMRLPSGYGLEIVMLLEALRHRAPVRICQVEIAERYDETHQNLSPDDSARGLNRMARDVGTHLLRTLATAGVVLSTGLLESLLTVYQCEAQDAVADSHAVAKINGLEYGRQREEVNVETFVAGLKSAIDEFRRDPLGPPLVPNWARVWAGAEDAGPWLLSAVREGFQ